MRDRYRSASPAACVGVVYMTQKAVYQSADVKNVAHESWRHGGSSVRVNAVDESVVSLLTAADANALFAKFSEQWQQCDGKTLTAPTDIFVRKTVTDVRVTGSVVAATTTLAPKEDSILSAVREARALGARGNCLVEVAVKFFGNTYPSDEGSADVNTSAVDIAHSMMDNASALS